MEEKMKKYVIALVDKECGYPPIFFAKFADGLFGTVPNRKEALVLDESDATIADLITDGCNMGVKSLTKYLNEYSAAAPEARAVTKELIALEEQTTRELQPYL